MQFAGRDSGFIVVGTWEGTVTDFGVIEVHGVLFYAQMEFVNF